MLARLGPAPVIPVILCALLGCQSQQDPLTNSPSSAASTVSAASTASAASAAQTTPFADTNDDPKPTPKVAWRLDAPAALRDALAHQKPVLVDFWADWCAPCHTLDNETFSNPDVAQTLSRFVTIRVDMTLPTPEANQMAARYQVVQYPTVLLIDAHGVLRGRLLRAVSAQHLLARLREVL